MAAASPLPALPPAESPLRRHRFVLGSVVLHIITLAAIAQWQDERLSPADDRLVQASTQAAQRHNMRRQLDSLKTLKELAERIERAQHAEAEPAAQPPETLANASAPVPTRAASATAPPTPQEMLAQARELRDSIRKMEEKSTAEAMVKALDIPPQEALAKLLEQSRERASAEAEADGRAGSGDEQVAATLQRYEQESRTSLERMRKQMEHYAGGTSIENGAKQPGSGQPGTGKAGAGQPGAGADNAPVAGGANNSGTDRRLPSNTQGWNRIYDGSSTPFPVNAATLRLGQGNSIGAGGVYANRIYVNQWYVIGPFQAANSTSIHQVFPPEQLVDLDAAYRGKGNRVVRWQYVHSASYPLVPPQEADQSIYYGYTEIRSDRARDVWMSMGADDDAKLWVNDRLVWSSGNQAKFWYTQGGFRSRVTEIAQHNLVEARRLVHLEPGRNRLLFKLHNGPLDVFFALVLDDIITP